MRRLRVGPPSPALIIALIALFVSLGGVSYGLARGSVGTRAIKNNSVRSKDLRNNNARSKDIRNGTLRGKDVFADTLGGREINESTLNINTPTVGGGGLKNVLVRSSTVPLPANTSASAEVSCNTGEKMLGGGGSVGKFANTIHWLSSRPTTATGGGLPTNGSTLTRWRTSALNGAGATTITAWASCLQQ
jgi:hypothetical protein